MTLRGEALQQPTLAEKIASWLQVAPEKANNGLPYLLTKDEWRQIIALQSASEEGDTSDPNRPVKIEVNGSVHVRTAQQWLELARASLRPATPRSEPMNLGLAADVHSMTGECPVCGSTTAPQSETPAIPDGMVLVPRYDLEHFIRTGVVQMWAEKMLAAAPSPNGNDNEMGGAR